MGPAFWSNTFWFILLGITTIIELIIIFFKVNNRKRTLGLYFTISGLTFCFEMIIYSYFKSYEYFPMFIPHSPPDDSIAGNLFSQFSVSATALLIAALNLKYYWYFVFAGVYGVIEEVFLSLGIYKHNWYQTWMTVLGLLVLFWITKKAYTISLKQMGRVLRYLFIFLGLVALYQNSIIWVLRLVGIQLFSDNFIQGKERSLVVLTGLYMLLLSVTIMIMYFSKIKLGWKILIIFTLYIAHFAVARLNLITYHKGWFLISSSISIWGMYFYIYILDKLYKQSKQAI